LYEKKGEGKARGPSGEKKKNFFLGLLVRKKRGRRKKACKPAAEGPPEGVGVGPGGGGKGGGFGRQGEYRGRGGTLLWRCGAQRDNAKEKGGECVKGGAEHAREKKGNQGRRGREKVADLWKKGGGGKMDT